MTLETSLDYPELRELPLCALQHLCDAVDRIVDQNDTSDESLDWAGIYALGIAVRLELNRRRRKYQ